MKQKELVSHGACGKEWVQRGNRTGHCARCHHTFEGITLFDSHQSISPEGFVICADPAEMEFQKQPLRLVDGTWRGPKFDNVTSTFRKVAK